mmetsp:Transcript_24932/g.58740  ORF Transcript_24932/g.58740 Transcript_24932/m.58740 type:complete len:226 (+) Transcript_24932:1439-2116(+)
MHALGVGSVAVKPLDRERGVALGEGGLLELAAAVCELLDDARAVACVGTLPNPVPIPCPPPASTLARLRDHPVSWPQLLRESFARRLRGRARLLHCALVDLAQLLLDPLAHRPSAAYGGARARRAHAPSAHALPAVLAPAAESARRDQLLRQRQELVRARDAIRAAELARCTALPLGLDRLARRVHDLDLADDLGLVRLGPRLRHEMLREVLARLQVSRDLARLR